MVQAGYKHIEVKVRKLLITKNNQVLMWHYSQVTEPHFKLESVTVQDKDFSYVLMERYLRSSDFWLLWVKTEENYWFSGSSSGSC